MNTSLEEEPKPFISKQLIKDFFYLAVCVLLIFGFKSTFYANYTVPTPSMVPNILPGDKLIVNRMAYNLRVPFSNIVLTELSPPERGDVVVFDYPLDPSTSFVKRLIGLPGDQVIVRDGFLRVNGKEYQIAEPQGVDEEILQDQGGDYTENSSERKYQVRRYPFQPTYEEQTLIVPADHYFVMGDNRDRSHDSRFWGYVPKSHLKGKAKFIYFSLHWKDDSWVPSVRWDRIGNTF